MERTTWTIRKSIYASHRKLQHATNLHQCKSDAKMMCNSWVCGFPSLTHGFPPENAKPMMLFESCYSLESSSLLLTESSERPWLHSVHLLSSASWCRTRGHGPSLSRRRRPSELWATLSWGTCCPTRHSWIKLWWGMLSGDQSFAGDLPGEDCMHICPLRYPLSGDWYGVHQNFPFSHRYVTPPLPVAYLPLIGALRAVS